MWRRCLSLIVLLAACGDDTSPPTSGVFVGELRGGEVFAASIWQSDRVLIYTCGRDGTLSDSTSWLIAPPSEGTVESSEGIFSVVATRDGAQVMGSWMNGTVTETLQLDEIDDATRAGFFAHIEGDCRTAAIGFEDGDAIAFQGAHFCDFAGPFFQVTPVLPPEALTDTIRVSFDDGSGAQEVDLTRLEGI